jgi:hypothetical protein
MSLWVAAAPHRSLPPHPDGSWRMAILPIPGPRPVSVAVASELAGALLLASVMFGTPAGSVEREVADDSLKELANIVAGQIKSLLAPDQLLGLPRVASADAIGQQITNWRAAKLKKNGRDVPIWIGVAEGIE